MHEMSICESLLQIIEEQAAQHGFSKVLRVRLEIGPLAGVETEALRFCFDAVCRDSVAEGAELEIIAPPVTGWCMDCAQQVDVRERFGPCPRCGGHRVHVEGGRELRIMDLEVE